MLASGGVVAYPTEAVFGLGCDPWDRDAVGRVLAIKGRDVSKGLILIAADFIQLAPFLVPLSPDRRGEILASWPGPFTWVLQAQTGAPAWLTGRFDTLAVRVTAHPLAAGLCRAFGGPIVSTSANRAGHRPARTALAVRRALGGSAAGGIDQIVPGACGGADRPSTIRDGRTGRVLRP